MAGDLRSSILTTAAVAVSVAGLTVIQPLTAAPPLLLAALLMDGGSGEIDSVGGIADAIQQRLLPSDSRAVIVNFLTGPFGIWNALDQSGPDGTVPSTTLGVTSTMPFLNQQGWNVNPQLLPPLAPTGPATVPGPLPPGSPVVSFDVHSMQIGEAIVTATPTVPVTGPSQGDVVTSFGYDFNTYAAVSLLNPLALSNSVAAYLNRALSPVQVNADGTVTCRLNMSCKGLDVTTERIDGILYVTFKNPDGTLVKAKVETRDGVTYVTYEDDGALPLVRPLRDYFGLFGNELADVIEPALTALVYWGYRDATTSDNSLLPTMAETIKSLLDFMVGLKKGIESLFVPHSAAAASSLARFDEASESVASDSEDASDSDSDSDDKAKSDSKDKDAPKGTPALEAGEETPDEVVDPAPGTDAPEIPAEEPSEEPETPVEDPAEEPADEEPTEGEDTEESESEEPVSEEPAEQPDADDDKNQDSADDAAPEKDAGSEKDTRSEKDKAPVKDKDAATDKAVEKG